MSIFKQNEVANFTPNREPQVELSPFRFWCQKVLPLVYDDSLSYYELLCKVVDYLNKTMEDVSNMDKDMTALYKAYEELQSYVNNYFSTLDVQVEINNKLDTMASDGTLSTLLSNIISGNSFPKFVSDISEMTDTKLTYVLSTNGHIYYYNDNAWIDSTLVYGSFNALSAGEIIHYGDSYPFNNMNDMPKFKVYFLYGFANHLSAITNLPPNISDYVVSYNVAYYTDDNRPGSVQYVYSNNGASYYRLSYGTSDSPEWSNWYKFNDDALRGGGIIHYGDSYPFNNMNDMPKFKVYFLYGFAEHLSAITNLPPNISDYVVSYNVAYYTDDNRPGSVQYVYSNNGASYYRLSYGTSDSPEWSNWYKILTNDDISTNEFTSGFSAFSSFCSVGDSLSVGYYTDSNGERHETDYFNSWVNFISRKYNVKGYWTGMSGAMCKTWLAQSNGTWGLEYCKSLGEMPLYIISMGANELDQNVGTIDSIGKNDGTLYGYISQVVIELRKISPKCFIVATGISRGIGQDENNPVNVAYKNVMEHYNKCYYLPCSTELNSKPLTDSYYNGHYNAYGYDLMSEIFNHKLSECMNKNHNDFIFINECETVVQPK